MQLYFYTCNVQIVIYFVIYLAYTYLHPYDKYWMKNMIFFALPL
jgi:hypothetical protein